MKKDKPINPFASRLAAFKAKLKRRRISAAFIYGEANQRGLVGFGCDNGCLCVVADGMDARSSTTLYTDFRYIPAAKREAPWLAVRNVERFGSVSIPRKGGDRFRIGYEGAVSAERFLALKKKFRSAELVDVGEDVLLLRAVKTTHEIAKLSAVAALNDRIWAQAQREIRTGMTEKDIQRVIRAWMNALGDGEGFETIVCVGKNAAECHHVPDDTVWKKGEPLLVDMGVMLDGYCSDLTRCIKGGGTDAASARYEAIYGLVLRANNAAIAAVKPGISGQALDKVARQIIRKAGYGKNFGHALGHGVGLEVHEAPVASKRSDTILKPGMVFTIEPGIYIENEIGIRIEDLVLVTHDGCEVLSSSLK